MIILEENFKWHLEAFASELFIYIYITHSQVTLLGTHLFNCSLTQISNQQVLYIAATLEFRHVDMTHGQDNLLKKGDSETTDLLGFSRTTKCLEFTENGLKKRKYPVSGSCVGENA